MPTTLAKKLWDSHVVRSTPEEPDLLYVDLHLIHEVTSPQAFEGLRLTGRRVRRPDLTVATMDHNVPTRGGVGGAGAGGRRSSPAGRWRCSLRTAGLRVSLSIRSAAGGRASCTSSGQSSVS